jgi:hypothetical protein
MQKESGWEEGIRGFCGSAHYQGGFVLFIRSCDRRGKEKLPGEVSYRLFFRFVCGFRFKPPPQKKKKLNEIEHFPCFPTNLIYLNERMDYRL